MVEKGSIYVQVFMHSWVVANENNVCKETLLAVDLHHSLYVLAQTAHTDYCKPTISVS